MPDLFDVGVCCSALVIAASVSAQNGPPDYGFDWVTIGNPGNRDTIPEEVPKDPGLQIGGVDHKFRIAREEVTVSQWLEFVNAYWPYWEGKKNDSSFTGFWIYPTNNGPGDPQYKMAPGSENLPTNMDWHVAARYCNWLTNGKDTDESDFDTGAYDASTFTRNEDGSWNDQPEHSPDAQFWIPTLDEWTKAVYYDPNRYGPGAEGYWQYCDGTDDKLIEDWPWNGGQTDARIPYDPEGPWLDVGSYPDILTPWWLLDASGGVREWLEDKGPYDRLVRGREQFDGSPYLFDRVDFFTANSPLWNADGLRLASAIPSPGGPIVFVTLASAISRKRRKQRAPGVI